MLNKTAPPEVMKIQVSSWFDIADTTGAVTTLKDTLYIYYKDKYVLYELPYQPIYIKETASSKGRKAFDYFIHVKKAAYGWKFKSLTDLNNGMKGNVDSLIKKSAFAGSANRSLVDEYTLLNDQTNITNSDTFTRKYYMNLPENDNYPDTVLLSFSNKLKDIDYPLSSYLDSLSSSKLYELKLMFRGGYYPEYKKFIPARMIKIKFEKADKIENIDTITKAFNAFGKMKL